MKMNMIFKYILLLLALTISLLGNAAYGAMPLTTDNRIKTFVYNENEVYLVVVHYGYQTSIEFSKNEEIETLSTGDSYAWKITPVGRRLFIKPLEESIHTNMTVITNKRTYHFDIASKSIDPDEIDTELAYVVRFFYPEVKKAKRELSSYGNMIDSSEIKTNQIQAKPNFNNRSDSKKSYIYTID